MLVSELALVTTTLLAIAGLQGTDRRLDPWMTLACLTKCHGRFLLLFAAKLLAFLGNTRMGHDLGQLFLVARCVKSTVEGRSLDFAANAPLQFGHCRYDRVLIQNAVAEHPV